MSAAIAAASPGSAQAARVGYEEGGPLISESGPPLTFQAAVGEGNRVAVAAVGASDYRVEDGGAVLQAGAGCRQTQDPHVVLCGRSLPDVTDYFVASLGDQDDTIRLGISSGGLVRGDSGNDVLLGGPGDDSLDGSQGSDTLDGGPGADRLDGEGSSTEDDPGLGSMQGSDDSLSGGPGPDILYAGGPGADQLHGGAGNDALFDGGPFPDFPTAPDPDLFSGGPGLDLAVYEVLDKLSAPELSVSFDGLPNDGRVDERDSIEPDLERVYSLAIGRRCRRRDSGRAICRFGRYRVTQRPGPNGERLRPAGSVSLRTYRLSGLGTAQAEGGVFETISAGGEFIVSERRSRTEISLPKGGLGRCRARGGTASKLSRRTLALLRARSGSGYRTSGRHSAATVRGTEWTVAELCNGTLTKVRRGTVVVRDYRRRKDIVLSAGRSYLARAPG